MRSSLFFTSLCLGFVLLTSSLPLMTSAQQPPTSQGVIRKDQVVAGNAQDSLEVRHLVLKGSNEEIGHTLAQIARERFQTKPQPSPDPLRTRTQRHYIEKYFPILYERMRGVASAYGQRLEDDRWNYSGLDFTELKAGCSVAYLPPQRTAAGTGVVSRDYDYSTGSIRFGFLEPGMRHPTSRPYVLEMHPDRGHASLALVSYDLLSGVLDGINSEGLTVTLAMDDELFTRYPMDPTGGPAPGLSELQTLRLLLDTCGNVTEAKEALLQTKQYYQAVPVHYLIADRFGNSFVWEYSHAHNREYIIENPGQPLVMTNFTLHRHMDEGRPPAVAQAQKVCRRYCRLVEQFAGSPDKVTDEFIKQAHKKVDAELPASAEPHRPPIRTFWHALYYPEQRRMQVSFYLRDEEVPGQPGKTRIVRSDYLEFRLSATNNAKPSVVEALPPRTNSGTGSTPARISPAVQETVAALQAGGGTVKIEDGRVIAVNLDKAADLKPLLPLLHRLPDLEELSIRNKGMDDAGMAQLKGLPKLTLLNVGTSMVGDDGLKVVATLPRLRTLYTNYAKVTDAGLAHLSDVTQLEVLVISGNPITDKGLAHLAKLTNITGLFLNATKVTDAGLEHLLGMGRLTKLNLMQTAVTDAGVAKIKPKLPSWVTIIRDKK